MLGKRRRGWNDDGVVEVEEVQQSDGDDEVGRSAVGRRKKSVLPRRVKEPDPEEEESSAMFRDTAGKTAESETCTALVKHDEPVPAPAPSISKKKRARKQKQHALNQSDMHLVPM